MMDDECYPFKKEDKIEIIKELDYDTKVQFKSPKAKDPVDLIFSLQKPKRNWSCYSSLVSKNGNKRSINYAIIVQDIQYQKHNLHEYKLNWEVDKHHNLLKWHQPQLCKDIKIFGDLDMNNGSI